MNFFGNRAGVGRRIAPSVLWLVLCYEKAVCSFLKAVMTDILIARSRSEISINFRFKIVSLILWSVTLCSRAGYLAFSSRKTNVYCIWIASKSPQFFPSPPLHPLRPRPQPTLLLLAPGSKAWSSYSKCYKPSQAGRCLAQSKKVEFAYHVKGLRNFSS